VARLLALAAALVVAAPATAAPPPWFSNAWRGYAVTGDRPADFRPTTVRDGGRLDVDFGHEVAGNLVVEFGPTDPGALVHVSFSETGAYFGDTTDWPREHATDDHLPTSGATWIDVPGCQVSGVCGDGYHAFRFARIRVEGGAATIAAVRVQPAAARATTGWFLSEDELLNRIWWSSLYTAQLTVMANDRAVLAGPGCAMGHGGEPVIVDGAKRDRCPWLGDQAVAQATLFLTGRDDAAIRNTLDVFADAQRADGFIPASPAYDHAVELADYPAYWALALRNLVLQRGTAGIEPLWPTLVRLLDTWLPRQLTPAGLVENRIGHADYAFVRRLGSQSAYLNGLYTDALRAGATVAAALGRQAIAAAWTARADALAAVTASTFWDAAAGAFRDTVVGPPVHPQDGNAFAVLGGAATPQQARSALAYLDRTTSRPWGNAIADNGVWDDASWGVRRERARVSVHRLLRRGRPVPVGARRLGRRQPPAHLGLDDRPAARHPRDDVGGDRPARLRRRVPQAVHEHGARVVDRRGAGADGIRARAPPDRARLGGVRRDAAPSGRQVGAGRGPDPCGSRPLLVAAERRALGAQARGAAGAPRAGRRAGGRVGARHGRRPPGARAERGRLCLRDAHR
jgi:hypothetical protein